MRLDFEMGINMENKLSASTTEQQQSERKSPSACLASRHVEQCRDWTCLRRNFHVGPGQTVAS